MKAASCMNRWICQADHRRAVRVERAVALRSERLRAAGVADAVELPQGMMRCLVDFVQFRWNTSEGRHNSVWLTKCSSARRRCFGGTAPRSDFLRISLLRRVIGGSKCCSEELRSITMDAARPGSHDPLGSVPPPEPGPQCRRCSLLNSVCQTFRQSAADYVQRLLFRAFGPPVIELRRSRAVNGRDEHAVCHHRRC